MYHTSPNKINKGDINEFGIAGSCLFFSDDVYVMTASSEYFTYEADFNCIPAYKLHDEEIINEIAEEFDCDAEVAESLLDASMNHWELFNEDDDALYKAEKSWWLQGKRGECAVKMGFDGCEDQDEQGTVYIVPMLNREDELTLVSAE